jgi:predicted metalloprotease
VRRVLGVVLVVAVVTAFGVGPALAGGNGGGSGGEPTLNPDKEKQAQRTKGYEKTVALALTDIQEYWGQTFPDLYGDRYTPIPKKRIIAARPGVALPKCQGHKLTYSDAENNAFYCFRSNYIAYDDQALFPQLFHDFGDFSIALVLAHEWGHAIQDRADNANQPTILKELQADCFAGSWVAHLAQKKSFRLELKPGNLDSGLTALLQFKDPVGTTADTEGAHGSGFDRVSEFQDGFDNGPSACAAYFDTPPTIVETGFTSEEDLASGGNLPAADVIPATVDILNDYYTQNLPGYVPLPLDNVGSYDSGGSKSQLPTCGGTTPPLEQITNRLFYCLDDGFIAFDEPYVQHVYDDIGDFGVATLLSTTWATYVQEQQGFPGVDTNEDNAVFGAYCYTGGFSRALADEQLHSQYLADQTGSTETGVAISPGDLDETIQAVIDYTAARKVDSTLDATFSLIRSFREGFTNGSAFCQTTYGATG